MEYKSEVDKNDSNRDAGNKILNAHLSGQVVIILGKCRVSYEGEVWKYLDQRQRTVILNPSGSVLVHGTKSVEPKAWQSEKANTTVDIDDDGDLVIESTISQSGVLQVVFDSVQRTVHYTPSDGEVEFVGSEEDLHQYLIENPDQIEEGFTVLGHEKEINVGRIDIFGEDKNNRPTIIEVKRRKAQLKHVDQLNRYVESYGDNCRGILVAPESTSSAEQQLKEKGYDLRKIEPSVILDD